MGCVMKRYPKYKESGVDWIGKIPEHWETLRIKRAVQLRNERRNDLPEGWPYIGLEDVESESGKYAPTQNASRQSDDSMVGVFRTGDVLYGKLRPYLRKAIVAAQDGVCSTEFLVLSEGRAAASWVQRWLLTPEVTQEIEAGCDGAKMPRADWEHVGSIPMPLPAVAEQIAISSVLDRATARIDTLIEKKARFVELLKEKRQALIAHVVTKGLDPKVNIKDSGVEWIGRVPEHWYVKRLKYMLTSPLKYGANEAAELDDPDMPRFVRITDIDENDSLRNETFKSLPAAVAREYLLREGDLLFARSGATAGKTFLYRSNWGVCAYAGYLIRARLDFNVVHPEFVRYFTASASYWQWLSAVFIQATIQNVSAEKYANLVITQPALVEQRAIVSFLNRETHKIDLLARKVQRSIAILKERRAALITAAVTGQIDLREEAA